MKQLLKITIAAVFLSISIQAAYATEQTKDLLIINDKRLELLSYPLESYFSQKGIFDKDIPWLDKTYNVREVLSTALYRGYRATWKVENDSIFLIKIENSNFTVVKEGDRSADADLKVMFGKKYKNGKVFADWINEDLFTQFGFFLSSYPTTMRSMEIKYTVNKGVIQSINKYSTLTGENTPNVIRIWIGKQINTEDAKEKIYTIVSKNFRWSKAMTENKEITLTIRIGNNFSNTVLSPKQEELMGTKEVIAFYQKEKKIYEKKKTKEAFDISKLKYFTEIIIENENSIPLKKKEAEEEYERDKVYLDEFARILKPLKIETVLFRGKQHIFRKVELHFHMDAKNKTITKDASKKSY